MISSSRNWQIPSAIDSVSVNAVDSRSISIYIQTPILITLFMNILNHITTHTHTHTHNIYIYII